MAVPEQLSLKVHITALDNVNYKQNKAKNKWEVGNSITVQIEGHATVNMLKQRIALIVLAHPKNQFIYPKDDPLPPAPAGGVNAAPFMLDDAKLDTVPGLMEKRAINVAVYAEKEAEEPMPELSDDELAVPELSEAELARARLEGGEGSPFANVFFPDEAALAKTSDDMSDADAEKQGKLRETAQDAIEDGDVGKAINLLSEALALGGEITAMAMAKRGDLLFKQKEYALAARDCECALKQNSDSGRAHRILAKALRFEGKYKESAKHFNEAQNIDYDDGVADMHTYVQKRSAKIEKIEKMTAEAAAKTAEAAAKEGEASK